MRLIATMAGAVLLLAALPIVAHHSIDAEFDKNKPVTVKGTVTKIEWMNPHIWLYVEVKGTDGKMVQWQFEGGPPNALKRGGWNRDSLKVGDLVTVDAIMAKVGPTTGNAQSVVLPDGRRVLGGQNQEGK